MTDDIEQEENEKKRQLKKNKREKGKIRKKEFEIKKQEEEAKQRFLNLTDEQKVKDNFHNTNKTLSFCH